MTNEATYNDMLLAGALRLTSEWMPNMRPEAVLMDVATVAKIFYAALRDMSLSDTLVAAPAPETPAVQQPTKAQIKASIKPDGLVNFEDGKIYKSLKRTLALRGLTPQAYRAKWGLPADYPMTSPASSAQRSALAKSIGLGRKR